MMWLYLVGYKNYLTNKLIKFIITQLERVVDYLYSHLDISSDDSCCTSSLVVGDRVRFKKKVFELPYSPYYDKYLNAVFLVVEIDADSNHVKLVNEDPSGVDPEGLIHDDELELVEN